MIDYDDPGANDWLAINQLSVIEGKHSRRPDVDFGSNIAGIVAGGLSEQLSLIVGFNNLIMVAMAYYLLALLFGRRTALMRLSPSP